MLPQAMIFRRSLFISRYNSAQKPRRETAWSLANFMSNTLQTSVHVTAIVPARNEEEVIEACVESLAVQTEIGEILVVDDQSTDKTAAIVTRLLEQIPKLRLLQT